MANWSVNKVVFIFEVVLMAGLSKVVLNVIKYSGAFPEKL